MRKLQASLKKPRSKDETRMGMTNKEGHTRYRGRIEKIERPRDGLLAVLADYSTGCQWNQTGREGGELGPKGPTL